MAEGTLELIPQNLCEESEQTKVLMLTDNLPTGYHAVVGAGIRPATRLL
jgi:hypothetical protein